MLCQVFPPHLVAANPGSPRAVSPPQKLGSQVVNQQISSWFCNGWGHLSAWRGSWQKKGFFDIFFCFFSIFPPHFYPQKGVY